MYVFGTRNRDPSGGEHLYQSWQPFTSNSPLLELPPFGLNGTISNEFDNLRGFIEPVDSLQQDVHLRFIDIPTKPMSQHPSYSIQNSSTVPASVLLPEDQS